MRKYLIIFTLFALTITSCQKTDKGLSDAIPADASYVVSINTKSLLKKSDDAQVKELLKKEIESALANVSLDEKKQQIADEFVKDPTKIGFDLQQNIYVYKTDQVSGVVVGIDDKNKIKTLLTKSDLAKSEDIKEKESVYTFSPSADIIIAWDDSRLLILKAEDTSVSLSKLAIAQLHHTTELSMSADKTFQSLEAELKDVAVLQKDTPAPLGNMKSTFSTVTHISFDAGKVVAKTNIVYKDPQDNIAARFAGQIKGTHAQYTDNSDVLIQTNLKGDAIYEYLEEGNVTKEAKMLAPNLKDVVSNFDGDLTLVVKPGQNEDGQEDPKIYIFAEIKEAEPITNLIDGLSGLFPIKKNSATSYSFNNYMTSFYLDIDGKTLRISNSGEELKPNGSIKKKGDNKFEFGGKASFFKKQRNMEALNAIDNFKISVPDDNSIIFTADMLDKDRNSFASILEVILKNKDLFSRYL